MCPPKEDKSLDVFGIKPVGDSVKAIVDSALSGAAAFLSRICLPASEEFGLLLRDKVSAWRAQNLARIVARAEKHINERDAMCTASPRVLMLAVEQGSWADDDQVQAMWAGLISSSCTADGKDDSNLLFMNLLGELSVIQVRVLSYGCARVQKFVTETGLIVPGHLSIPVSELFSIAGIADLERLDRELDHLRSLELMPDDAGFNPYDDQVGLSPTTLSLHLYVRAHGYLGTPTAYFASELKPHPRKLGRKLRQMFISVLRLSRW